MSEIVSPAMKWSRERAEARRETLYHMMVLMIKGREVELKEQENS